MTQTVDDRTREVLDGYGVDLDALRAKYREERDKRIRPDGVGQYIRPAGDFGYYVDDPWIAVDGKDEAGLVGEPLTDHSEVLVVGGGFGGLLAGVRLRQQGFEDVRVIEKGGDFGGTWYWNRYPGVRCDVESYVYMPLLEELGVLPTEKYARGQDILAHAQAIARHWDLYRDAHFGRDVTSVDWDESTRRWTVRTDVGDVMTCTYLILSSGPFNRPKLPGIPGIDGFTGHSFHTSRWDYGYTGGDQTGGLEGLRDKTVGIIGTGATAIQVVPQLARYAKHVYVFQRTPSSVSVRANGPTDPEWAASLQPGWQERRQDNFTRLLSNLPETENLVGDGWTDLPTRVMRGMAAVPESDRGLAAYSEVSEIVDAVKMNEIRARVDDVVTDPATAESLKPWYRYMCKRPGFSDEYLQAFNLPNVTLVDTEGRGVESFRPEGPVVDGKTYPVDCMVHATGFNFTENHPVFSDLVITGRDGSTMREYWKDGQRSLHGFYTHGFPNLVCMGMGQNGGAFNFVHVLQGQATHIALVLAKAKEVGAEVEPTAEAQDRWVHIIYDRPEDPATKECTPSYFNDEGKLKKKPFYGSAPDFHDLLAQWRSDGKWDEVLRPAGQDSPQR